MLLSASAAVESIAVNSDLENIRKIKKDACINNMWNKKERLRERFGAKRFQVDLRFFVAYTLDPVKTFNNI